ncbi:MAG: TolC family protein [Ignavibacteria bacterium]|jgi:outer membrane protein TolC|nr:TolC family protein [Ignavibacteria bacterium]
MKRLFIIFLLIISSNFLYSQGLNDLISSAVTINSKLKPLEYEKLAALTKINQNNKQPAPMIEIMQDRIPFSFMNAGEFTASYSQPLKLFGKTTASEEYYSYLALKPDIMREELRKDIIKDVKENYFMLFQNERMLSTNLLEQEIIKSITSSIEIKYSVGKGNQNDIFKSNSELQKLLYDEIQLKSEKKIILNNLRTLTGISLPEDYKTKNVELLISRNTIYNDTLQLQKLLVENNPEFKYLEYESKVTSLERNIAELERKPDITLKTGYMYMSDVNEHAFQLGIGIDLPFMPWNSKRIDAMIQENDYKQKQIESNYNSVLIYAVSEMRNKISLVNAQTEKIKFIKEITIPQLEQTLKSGLISYQTGEFEYMNIIDSYRMLRENDFKLIEEETKFLLYMNELERLVSTELLKIN